MFNSVPFSNRLKARSIPFGFWLDVRGQFWVWILLFVILFSFGLFRNKDLVSVRGDSVWFVVHFGVWFRFCLG